MTSDTLNSTPKSSSQHVALLWVLIGLTLPLAGGCQNDATPPPMPAPKAQATTPVLQLPIEEEEEEEEEEPKKTGKGVARSSLSACCAALKQNSVEAPQPTKGYLETAAAACQSADKNNGAKLFLSGISSMLRGAGVPSACK